MQIVAGILAGGESRRFPGGKLNVRVNDQPILAWQAGHLRDLLASCGMTSTIVMASVAPGNRLPTGVDVCDRIVRDAQAHQGPLAGLAAMLDASDADTTLLVVPADMLLIDASQCVVLLETLADQRAAAAVMWRTTTGNDVGRVQPFPSLWRVARARPIVQDAMTAGRRSPSRLAELDTVALANTDRAPAAAFMSMNQHRDIDVMTRHANGLLRIDMPDA